MATMQAAAPLGWSAKDLFVVYSELLKSSPAFREEISSVLDLDSWVKVNLLLDEGIDFDVAAQRVGVTFDFIVAKLIPARVCLNLYKSEPKKLAECLQGKLRD